MAMDGNTLGDAMLAAVQALPAGDPSLPVGAPANNGTQLDPQAAMRAMGGAIVAHVQGSAVIHVKNTDAGLQRDHTAGTPATLAPAATVTLPAGCIQ